MPFQHIGSSKVWYWILVGILFQVFPAFSQHALENIIVEKYYISDASDSAKSGGSFLPAGSVTYRVYADLRRVCRLQAVYGVEGHPLEISTSTWFYNHPEYGATVAENIPNKFLTLQTVMLDSWLSVSAACQAGKGVLKEHDQYDPSYVNADSVLQNEDPNAGIPIKHKDGIQVASPVSVVTFFGFDSTQLALLGNTNEIAQGQRLYTENASWASFGGAVGVDSLNQVLIGQFTTKGEFSFKLNLQIATPEGKIENYVADNPTGNEIKLDCLSYPVIPTKKTTKRH